MPNTRYCFWQNYGIFRPNFKKKKRKMPGVVAQASLFVIQKARNDEKT